MPKIKILLLLTLAPFFLYGCGGSVENPSTTPGDTTGPNFISGDPIGSVTEACFITAEFDEPIAESSITDQSFTIIEDITGTQLLETNGDGTWGIDPSSNTQALFTPNITLSTNQYTVTVTTAITDTAGNPLVAEGTWAFTPEAPCPPSI